jgi:hypothetical protein
MCLASVRARGFLVGERRGLASREVARSMLLYRIHIIVTAAVRVRTIDLAS